MINNNQKGISVYITIIMLSVLLAVSLGLSSIIVGGAKMVDSLDGAVKAFHAADTGIEEALYRIRVDNNCANFSGTLGAGSSYSVVITYTTCGSGGTSIKSIGTYNTTNRKIEASF